MEWKKNEIEILRNFSCHRCKVTITFDKKIDNEVYQAYCPRCNRSYIVKIKIQSENI